MSSQESATSPWLIAGLGNPGDLYAAHRHNIGFSIVEAIARTFLFPPFTHKQNVSSTKGKIGDHPIILACPLLYMNRSGEALLPWIRLYKEYSLLVIHDELDLNCGTVRYKKGGGTGGHNGLKSIHAHIGEDYARIRIGIDHPGHGVSSYVLHPFSSQQRSKIQGAVDHFIACLPLFLDQNLPSFLQKLHTSSF